MKPRPLPLPVGERASSLALALSLSLLAGCGGENGGDATPSFQRLELRPVAAEVEVPEPRVLATWRGFDEGEGIKGWELRGAGFDVVPVGEKRFLRVQREEGATIGIPAPLTFEGAAEVEIDMIVQSVAYPLTVRLLAGGRELKSCTLHLPYYRAEQQFLFKFPSDLRGAWSIDRIELDFPRGKEASGLAAITVREVSLGQYLPEGSLNGLDLVELDGDARRARCLGSSAPLRTSFRVTEPTQELILSYAQPVELRLPEQTPELRVSLSFADGRQDAFTFPLAEDEDPPHWHRDSIDVGEWVGQEGTATFELRSEDPRPGMCVLSQPWLVSRGSDAPTVLLITSDTHRSDHVGFLSRIPGLHTGTIDRLASEGVAFTDAFSSINNTTPSHVALFTGLSPRDTGLVANARPLAEAAPTLAECFRDLGYATLASVSAAPVNYSFCGLGQGFDRYSSPGLRSSRSSVDTLEQLEEWLPELDRVPLFVWLHIYDAHGPYRPPEKYWRMYYPPDADPYDANRPGADPSIAPGWDRAIADPAYTEALYKGEISCLDERLGAFLTIDRFWNGTVAFTADHGEDMRYGEHPFDHNGLSLSTLSVPLIFKSPGLPAGVRRQDPVLMIDVGRTLLDLAGHPEAEFPGRDLFDTAAHAEGPRFAIQANGTGASVQLGRWMLVLTLHHSEHEPRVPEEEYHDRYHEVRLFDLESDPGCTRNVWEENRDETVRLRGLLIRWLTESAPRGWQDPATALGTDVARNLAELGYVSSGDSGGSEEWIDPDCQCKWCKEFE